MLKRVRELLGRRVEGEDGELGRLADLYFSDRDWSVRHLMIDCGGQLKRAEALIAPARVKVGQAELQASLTLEDVAASPDVSAVLPVSRVRDAGLSEHALRGPDWLPTVDDLNVESPTPSGQEIVDVAESRGLAHLRSYREIRGYGVRASGEDAGQVADLVCDPEKWVLRYAIASVRPLLRKKEVLVSVDWITGIRWSEQQVEVDVSRDRVETSPRLEPLSRSYEERVHEHYGRARYWSAKGDG